MMSAEFCAVLMRLTLASSLALLVVLLLRKPLRIKLGARAAYATWILVPTVIVAMLIPAPVKPLGLLANAPSNLRLAEIVSTRLAASAQYDSSALLLTVWSMGALIALGAFARRQSRFNRLIQRREDQPYDEMVEHGPAVSGLLRPRIVMPSDFRQRYSETEQLLVLAHERLHLQRGDVHAHALATALRCLFWFNPLVHYAAARFRFDQELACDAAVLERFPKSRRAYGDAMLKTRLAEFGLPVGCYWQSSHPLKERIAMLKHPLPGRLRRASGLMLIAAMVTTGTFAAWAAQPGASSTVDKSKASVATASTPATPLTADALTPPRYPVEALVKHLGGKVVLQLRVGADGSVKDVKIVSSKPAGVFDQAAMEAASKWRFNPAKDAHGNNMESWVQAPVTFEPNDPKKSASAK
jgi:TonB family protein